MEHLDSLAGSIAYKHVLGSSVESVGAISDAGFYIVTAAIDRYVIHFETAFCENLMAAVLHRLDMLSPLTPQNVHDIRLSGQVISVGSSSMEIGVKMESANSSEPDKTLLIGILRPEAPL
jgi:acyl-coenzyme A thioesterase 9